MLPCCRILAIALVAAACGGSVSEPPAGTRIPLTRLSPNPYPLTCCSGIGQSERLIVRDNAAWQTVWTTMWRGTTPTPPLPNVDFTKEMVIVAALGSRSTGGYGIVVDSALMTSSGLSARHPLSDARGGELFAQLYGGTRNLYNPLTFAVVDVGRKQFGGGVRATVPFDAVVKQRVSIGADAALQNDLRKNWANCNGLATPTASCPTLPVEKGALQLDQYEIVSNVGPYVRDELDLGDRFTMSGGVRADVVRFQLKDHFLADGRDDSGVRVLHAVSPMVGAVARVSQLTAWYANVGSAFETPTTTELGNQPNGNAGLNYDLKPQFSTTYETGLKGWLLNRVQYDVSAFDIEVRDELIPYEVPGGNGRTYYRNAGRTRRNGAEMEAGTAFGPFAVSAAYTYSHFRFKDFLSGGVQYSGNVVPGIPEQQVQGSVTWRHDWLFVTAEAQAKSAVYVDDANSSRAAGFAVYNLRLGGEGIGGMAWLSPMVSVQNLFDRKYVGSVAVNAAGTPTSAKYYEPGAGRTVYVGLTMGVGR